MADINNLIKKIEKSGQEIFWLGEASLDEIMKLELLLKLKLPSSYKTFLATFGGGGVIGDEISGIEDNNAELDYGGTVYGDTTRCIEEYELPENLITIFYKNDEICWCLNTAEMNDQNECPVVSYNVFNKKVDINIAVNFKEFFEEYLMLRAGEY
jgi:hypothetical protein